MFAYIESRELSTSLYRKREIYFSDVVVSVSSLDYRFASDGRCVAFDIDVKRLSTELNLNWIR